MARLAKRRSAVVIPVGMSSDTCGFCGHGNPAGAKYCNECAAPAHLWRCRQCDAVNERSAPTCPRCGAAPFVDEVEDDSLESLTFDSELDFGPSTLGGGDRVPGQAASGDSSRVQKADLRRASGAATDVVEILAHKSPTGAWVTPSFYPPQHAAPVAVPASDTKVRRRRAIPVAITALVMAAGAVGVYLSGTRPGDDGAVTDSDSQANRHAPQLAVPAVDRTGTGATLLATMPTTAPPSSVIEGRIRMVDKPSTEQEKSAVGASLAAPSSPDAATALSSQGKTDSNAVKRSNASKTRAPESVGPSQPRRSIAASSSAPASAFPDAETLVVRPAVGARDEGVSSHREPQRPCTDPVATLGLCSAGAQARSQ